MNKSVEQVKPFWNYYGGKYRIAPKYPKPRYKTIIEPFAGAAGYSCRYPDREVLLVEKYEAIVHVWDYLIGVSSEEILRIPPVEHVDDLPGWVPEGARLLVGFCMGAGRAQPGKRLSAGQARNLKTGRRYHGWTVDRIERTARDVMKIKHWQIRQGSYEDSPVREDATYFVDPPYVSGGHVYAHSEIDYSKLGAWCKGLPGQVIVCENTNATWLPFCKFVRARSYGKKPSSEEVIWYREGRSPNAR